MEAMSIESLLLSTWEEDGFVGKARVPLGTSDVDVLAIHAQERKVRVGETKVREGSQKVYVIDDWTLTWIESAPHKDFGDWLKDFGDWHRWLGNLPKLWCDDGKPAVPWLPHASKVKEIQVVFCCNLYLLCAQQEVDDALRRAAVRYLGENPALVGRLDAGLQVKAEVKPTVEIVTSLIEAGFKRIEDGYGRRFGDNFKDLFREVHRYLCPALDRLPCDGEGLRLGTRKESFKSEIRKATVLGLLKKMGVSDEELREWLPGPPGTNATSQ